MGLLDKLRGKKHEVMQATGPITEAGLQDWLVMQIAAIAKVQAEDVDVDRPFAEFGMDSMQLFQLSGDLQKYLGREVSEIVAWDYPTIAQLSKHLASESAAAPTMSNIEAEEALATESQG